MGSELSAAVGINQWFWSPLSFQVLIRICDTRIRVQFLVPIDSFFFCMLSRSSQAMWEAREELEESLYLGQGGISPIPWS
ncbi:hypothetical protein NPIL_95801 [Nephila pilipes]|uniref:Uncharacterized protein n=1 Tax=Nephila pilipes TaxID=299642 RepID=A0A8X6I6B1_NEPPI|nr:hypothetical protein NPIL_95801 [Nephila pilipes]